MFNELGRASTTLNMLIPALSRLTPRLLYPVGIYVPGAREMDLHLVELEGIEPSSYLVSFSYH